MKKLNQQGIGHHLMIVAIAVIAVAGIGFAGWKVLTNDEKDASADSYNWSVVNSSYKVSGSTHVIYACKTKIFWNKWAVRTKIYNRGPVKTTLNTSIPFNIGTTRVNGGGQYTSTPYLFSNTVTNYFSGDPMGIGYTLRTC
jgi:hypothetical protein